VTVWARLRRLAHGERGADAEHADAAAMLRTAARVYAEALGAAVAR
jgi:hypothetical protein